MATATAVPLESLNLPSLGMDKPEFAADPVPQFRAAKQVHPWLAQSPFGYVTTDHGAVNDLLWMDDKMRTSFDGIVQMMGAKGTPWGRFTEEQMLAHSGDSHKRLRNLLASRFTPRQANQQRDLMRTVITELLDEWAPKGAFDFEEFASYFPIAVLVRMVGAPVEVIPPLRSSMETLGLGFSMDDKLMPKLQEAIGILDDFAHDLIAERRANPLPEGDSDMLEMMVDASKEGNLSDRELADLIIFLFVAGYDTSKNVLTYMMHILIDHPDDYRRCAEDHEYCRKVVEETLRLFSPAMTFRMTREDIVYRDVLIPRDTMIFFPLSVMGRDADAFERPDQFDPEREQGQAKYLAFGRGVHLCLGQYIARAQLQEGLHQIAQRIIAPRRDGPMSWRPFMGNTGIKGLPITFEQAEG